LEGKGVEDFEGMRLEEKIDKFFKKIERVVL